MSRAKLSRDDKPGRDQACACPGNGLPFPHQHATICPVFSEGVGREQTPRRKPILADPLADLIAHVYAQQHGFPTGLREARPQELVAIIVNDSTVLAQRLRDHGWIIELDTSGILDV